MNDILFYTLLLALIYYFFFYLPSQKKVSASLPFAPNKGIQTEIINHEPGPTVDLPGPQEIIDPKELERLKEDINQKEQTIIGLNNSYEKLETQKKSEIAQLQTQIRELAKRPTKPTNSKGTQTDNKDLENTLDNLIKNIQELNNEL